MFKKKKHIRYKTAQNDIVFEKCPWCGKVPKVYVEVVGSNGVRYFRVCTKCECQNVRKSSQFLIPNLISVDMMGKKIFRATLECALLWNRMKGLDGKDDEPNSYYLGEKEHGYWIVRRADKNFNPKAGCLTCSWCGMQSGYYDCDNFDRYCSHCGDAKTSIVAKEGS